MRCSDTLGAFINNWERKLYPNEFQDFSGFDLGKQIGHCKISSSSAHYPAYQSGA
eukprot:m.268455 g.268455  ORF g.268455 m.268455 type:complete len:55 (+) comp40528_c0_seq4:488-652(+)